MNILSSVRTIAMVGASDRMSRPSFGVFEFLLSRGYHAIGVNPKLAGKSVHGTVFYKSRPLTRHWHSIQGLMQLGVYDEEAAARARALGVKVVMDRCPAIETKRLAIRKS